MLTKIWIAILVVVGIGCGVAIWREFAPKDSSKAVAVAWKTVQLPDKNGRPQVDVFLLISGALERKISLGTFAGDPIPSNILLERLWWSGSDEVLSVTQKDASHLIVSRILLDSDEQIPGQEIVTIEIPEGAYLATDQEDPI